jgi:hypothetical protein
MPSGVVFIWIPLELNVPWSTAIFLSLTTVSTLPKRK